MVVLLEGLDLADLLEVILEDREPTPHMMGILEDQGDRLRIILEVLLGDTMEGLGDIMEGLAAPQEDTMEVLEDTTEGQGDTTEGQGDTMEDLEAPLRYTKESQGDTMEDLGVPLWDIMEDLAVPQWDTKEGQGCLLEGMWEDLVHLLVGVSEGQVQQNMAITRISMRVGASGRVAGRWR